MVHFFFQDSIRNPTSKEILFNNLLFLFNILYIYQIIFFSSLSIIKIKNITLIISN